MAERKSRMDKMNRLRKRIVELAYKAKEGHIPSALSVLDIIWTLYDSVMTPDDRFILSKGHASLALYAVLEAKGLIEGLDSFGSHDSHFGGHPQRGGPILASTGSLGHTVRRGPCSHLFSFSRCRLHHRAGGSHKWRHETEP